MKNMHKLGVHIFYRPRKWGDGGESPEWSDPETTQSVAKRYSAHSVLPLHPNQQTLLKARNMTESCHFRTHARHKKYFIRSPRWQARAACLEFRDPTPS